MSTQPPNNKKGDNPIASDSIIASLQILSRTLVINHFPLHAFHKHGLVGFMRSLIKQ